MQVPIKIIDLRSDTVTLQTPDVIEAMRSAVVGDFAYGVNLQIKCRKILLIKWRKKS